MQKVKNTISLPELAAVILLVLLWSLTVWAYVTLPESIPVHFNFKGEVDRYGNKSNLFFLAIVATIIYIGLTLLPAKLGHFDFPRKNSDENSNAQRVFTGNVFLFLKIVILVIFLVLNMEACLIALKLAKGIGMWFYLLLAILFLPSLFIIGKAFKTK